MSLKRKLSKAQYEKLPEVKKDLYKEVDGSFHLDLDSDDDEDLGALKRAKEHEVARRKEAETKLKALEEKESERKTQEEKAKSKAKEEKAKNDGDIDALETSWKEKLAKEKASRKEDVGKYQQFITDILVNKTAEAMAAEISTVPKLLTGVIASRMKVEFDGDSPQLRILDSEGKPSASSLQEFKTELLQDKELSPILIGSKASGGSSKESGDDRSPSLTGAPTGGGEKPLLYSEMTPTQLAAEMAKIKD